MAVECRRLQVLGRAGSFTSWYYGLLEDELIEAAHVDGYFDQAHDKLSVGDTILMSGLDGCALRGVTSVAAGSVVLAAPV